MVEPVLVDLPSEIETTRLIVRAPRAGDGEAVNAAIEESFAELQPWMPWARAMPTVDETEAHLRKSAARFLERSDLAVLAFRRDDGLFVVGSGLHRIDWSVPRFEIGYWCRTRHTKQGYTGEVVRALTELAFTRLQAARVEIRCDARNTASRRVAEKAGFELEGVLRRDVLGTDGVPRDTCVYARI